MQKEDCQDGLQSKLTRRSFIKTTGAAAGVAAVGGTLAPLLSACTQQESSPSDPTVEKPNISEANCVCKVNCFGGCRIKATVRDGYITNLAAAPMKNEHYNRICLRGLSSIQRVYDPDRIKYPMKRVEGTERGAGQWEQLTWDEAITLIADKIMEAQKNFGPQSVAIWPCTGSISSINGGHGGIPSFMLRLTNVIGATSVAYALDAAHAYGQIMVLGAYMANGHDDLVNSKTIACWGYNATESTMHTWHLIADGMDAGAKLVVIDPTFTTLASKADWWIPIRPATDTALVLSCMQVLYAEGKMNVEFLRKHTVAPYLVKEDGKFLRMSDLGVAPTEGPKNPTTGAATQVDPVVVWDEGTQAGVSENEVTAAAIEGEYTVNGFKCRTAFSHLVDEFMQYPPEKAAEITEIDADSIVRLARMFGEGKVAHLLGYGGQAFANGVATGTSIATLPALLGDYGIPGAQNGKHWKVFPGFNYAPNTPDDRKAAATVANLILPEMITSGKYKGEDWPLKILWCYVGNPLSTSGDTNLLLNTVWPGFDFIITSDTTMTDTARYSDLVLPTPHYFEQEEVHASGEHGFIFYAEKAIDPLFEAKTDSEIVRLVADKIGVGEYFSMTNDEFLQDALDTDYCRNLGISLEALKEEGCMLDGTNPSIPAEGLNFKTPTKKIEFYFENPKPRMDHGQKVDLEFERVPRFKPPLEAWPEFDIYKTYPLILMSERPRFRVHSSWWNVPWLRELEPEPIIKINPEDAKARGIENGSYLEAYNDRGTAVGKAVYSTAIRKGTLVYPKGWQAHQHKSGSWSELVSYAYDPFGVNANFMDVLCEVRPWKG